MEKPDSQVSERCLSTCDGESFIHNSPVVDAAHGWSGDTAYTWFLQPWKSGETLSDATDGCSLRTFMQSEANQSLVTKATVWFTCMRGSRNREQGGGWQGLREGNNCRVISMCRDIAVKNAMGVRDRLQSTKSTSCCGTVHGRGQNTYYSVLRVMYF